MLKKGPLKVLFVSAEVAPYSKAGGLSQVSYFLPNALRKKRLDVRIFTPKYASVPDDKYKLKYLARKLRVPTGSDNGQDGPSYINCAIQTPTCRGFKSACPVYFLENDEYFGKRSNVYGYNDDHIRFGLFSRAVAEFIKSGEFVPDIVHCNDWHSGYAINLLSKQRKSHPSLSKIALVLSIHNTTQGEFEHATASSQDFDDGKGELASLFSDRFYKQNGLKRGVLHADMVNTVSERFSRELMREEYGAGLHELFKGSRAKLSGILNGLDYHDFNPKTDKNIKKNYSSTTVKYIRPTNKEDIQKEFALEVDPNRPIIAISGRLNDQKGVDLIIDSIETMLDELGIQFIVLGTGEESYMNFFRELENKYPGKVGTHLMQDFILPRKIFSGADMILMPSKYEPGGIVAIEAMRYGAVPIVRETGGLADIVEDYIGSKNNGTGFMFKHYTPQSMLIAVSRAVQVYKQKDIWNSIIIRVMRQNFSWQNVADEYIDFYQKAIRIRASARRSQKFAIHQQPVLGELAD